MAAISQSPALKKKPIVVLGAGVVGLTTAVKLQETGNYQVTIVAETIPSDPKTIKYTSQWAGAHHVYDPINATSQHAFEETTFNAMWELSAPGSPAEESFLRIPQTEYFHVPRAQPDPLEKMPNFRYLEPEELLPGCISGATFTTVTIDVPIYLNYLLMRFCAQGGRVLRGSIQHINQLLEGGTRLFPGGGAHDPLPEAVIVCIGLGARFLGGIEDKKMYPIRGQTVLIRAPWVRFGRTETLGVGASTYIIPRRSSDVIVGGTKVANDWYPVSRPEITLDILKRGLLLCPELAPPEIRAIRGPRLEDVLPHVVGEGCGLRPAREGGIRLEVEWVDGEPVHREGKIPLVHNYGHGGYGYQSSWGCADKVLELLDGALKTPIAKAGL
ncbi:D-amino-acid oxidase [Pholiota conissans]|uniref:D-amino-acid oxidase n=1 Tax=Pholiota conissans TaxID=109636 RepID=A0A9P6D828_9AGAR|nr:D-amino-acid oxidase [Pholiota conissans]